MGIKGIIRPPPEIRAVADKTASFVAKNGRAFETRILNSAKGKTPKFAFLLDASPFRAYYEDRVTFYENGGDNENSAKKEDGENDQGKQEEKAKNKDQGESEVLKEGGDSDLGTGVVGKDSSKVGGINVQKKKKGREIKAVIDPVARALLRQRACLEEIRNGENKDKDNDINDDNESEKTGKSDEKDAFVISPIDSVYTAPRAPSTLKPSQLELIKITAQFTALNGKGGTFLRDLMAREWNDPFDTFGFVQPRHGHFAYFTSLVDLYRRILAGSIIKTQQRQKTKQSQVKEEDDDLITKQRNIAKQATIRSMVGMPPPSATSSSTPKHLKSLQQPKSSTSIITTLSTTNTNQETSAQQLFREVHSEIALLDQTSNNPSKCLEVAALTAEMERMAREQRLAASNGDSNDNNLSSASAYIDWHDFVVVETIDFDRNEVVEIVPPPPPPSLTEIKKTKQEGDGGMSSSTKQSQGMEESSASSSEEDDDDDDDEDEEEEIRVESTYQPRVVSSQAHLNDRARTHMIDPITKRAIPIADTTEHMRIQLLDPKWAAEKKKFVDKQRESNFVAGDDIAKNVNAFAKARGDIFGVSANAGGDTQNSDGSSQRIDGAQPRPHPSVGVVPSGDSMPPLPPVPPSMITSQLQNSSILTASYPQHPMVYPPGAILPQQQVPPNAALMQHPKPDLNEPNAKKARVEDLMPGVANPTMPTTATAIPPSLIGNVPGIMQPPHIPNMVPPGLPLPPPHAAVPQPPATNESQPHLQQTIDNTTSSDTIQINTSTSQLSESEFLESLEDPDVTLTISIPKDSSSSSGGTWNFQGQTISLTVHAMTKIRDVKQELRLQLNGMPINKMQLKSKSLGFLKDASTLALLNIGGPNAGDSTCFELVPKVRGGRK